MAFTAQALKWRGVPISKLDHAELENARTRTCAVLAAINEEIQRRKTDADREIQ
jgi:hypothetical protein